MDTATKTGLDAAKTVSKKVIHKTVEATDELIRNKTAEKLIEPKPVPDANLSNVEEIVIPPFKRQKILNKLRQVLQNGTQNI